MTAPLLTTKLYIPPVRPELVSRPGLTERMNEGMTRKLTLVSAPAGRLFKVNLVEKFIDDLHFILRREEGGQEGEPWYGIGIGSVGGHVDIFLTGINQKDPLHPSPPQDRFDASKGRYPGCCHGRRAAFSQTYRIINR